METRDRYPRTCGAAWEVLLDTLRHEAVCYTAGNQSQGEFRPLRHDGVNCGEAVHKAVERLMDTSGSLSRDQILAISNLCFWVAKAARA
jgi:hypothetical protein